MSTILRKRSLARICRGVLQAQGGSLWTPSPQTCCSDSAGTMPAVQDGVVGFVLDSLGVLSTQNLLTNGNFASSGAAWSTSNSVVFATGSATLTKTSSAEPSISQTINTVPGAFYKITVKGSISALGGGGVVYTQTPYETVPALGAFTIQAYFKATSATATVPINIGGGSASTGVATVISVMVQAYGGNPLQQPTSAYKPILRKGAKNWLLYSNNQSSGWLNSTGASATTTTVTLGSSYTTYHYQQLAGTSAGATWTGGFLLSGTPGVQVTVMLSEDSGSYPNTAQVITLTATPTWYSVTRTLTLGGTIDLRIQDYGTATTVTVGDSMLTVGSTLPAPAPTTTASVTNGVGPWWLEFNGAQFLPIPGPSLVNSPYALGYAGVCLNTSSSSRAFRGSSTGTDQNLILGFSGAGAAMLSQYADDLNGTVTVAQQTSPHVMSGLHSSSTRSLRFNGVQIANDSGHPYLSANPGWQLGGASGGYWNGAINAAYAAPAALTPQQAYLIDKYLGLFAGVSL